MNLRQKAKRFKKLYEESLPKKLYPVIYQSQGAKHFKAQTAIDERERDLLLMQNAPELIKNHVTAVIIEQLKPVICEHIKQESEIYSGQVIYSVDIWL
jgi:hypothetical protein